MATRRDPSSTGVLVWAMARDIRAGFTRVHKAIWKKVVDDDSLGVTYHTDPQKIQMFSVWIQGEVDREILTTDALGNSWIKKYVDAAYAKGATRAYSDANKANPSVPSLDFMTGAKDQFLKMMLSRPNVQSRVGVLVSQAFENLRGLASYVVTAVNTTLSSGLIKGPIVSNVSRRSIRIAYDMAKKMKELVKHRAQRIAQDEMVRASSEGQLDSFEAQGFETVGLYAAWTTMGDDRVCPACFPLDGVQFTIEEARGLIPRHIGCRCGWSPGELIAGKNRTRTIRRRVGLSLIAERKTKGKTKAERLRKTRKESQWPGKYLVKKGTT